MPLSGDFEVRKAPGRLRPSRADGPPPVGASERAGCPAGGPRRLEWAQSSAGAAEHLGAAAESLGVERK